MKDIVGKKLLDKRIKVVLPFIEGQLLDICCGTNELVRTYPGKGIGIDVYQWGNVDKVVEDTGKLPFEDKTFDTVTILASLTYIPNSLEALMDAKRVLKDSGKLIITMIPPKISQIWHKVRESWDDDQSELLMKEGQLYGLTEKDLSKLLYEAGFEIELKKKFNLGLNNLTIAKKKANKSKFWWYK